MAIFTDAMLVSDLSAAQTVNVTSSGATVGIILAPDVRMMSDISSQQRALQPSLTIAPGKTDSGVLLGGRSTLFECYPVFFGSDETLVETTPMYWHG
jgi:hypothetical protein